MRDKSAERDPVPPGRVDRVYPAFAKTARHTHLGAYISGNEWQSFQTRQDRDLERTTVTHVYRNPGRYTIAVKVTTSSATTR